MPAHDPLPPPPRTNAAGTAGPGDDGIRHSRALWHEADGLFDEMLLGMRLSRELLDEERGVCRELRQMREATSERVAESRDLLASQRAAVR